MHLPITLNSGQENQVLELWLLHQKALYYPAKKALILSDLHLGKSAHFRKNGLYLPDDLISEDLDALESLLVELNPLEVWIAGDLFHSRHHPEYTKLAGLINKTPSTSWKLIPGNHDKLSRQVYDDCNICLMSDIWDTGDFVICHEPIEPIDKYQGDKLIISGHIHPGYRLSNRVVGSVTIPCFFLSGNQLIMPSFGQLTGLKPLKKGKHDRVFGVVSQKVIEI